MKFIKINNDLCFLSKSNNYKFVFIGNINEIHILTNEKSNREVPGFFKYPAIHPGPKTNRHPRN